MTSTTSPDRTSAASRSAVASTEPGATTGMSGAVRADVASASAARRGDRRVRIAAGPDVGDRDRVGTGEHLGELLEHGRGPMEGQRLVDRPDPATRLALADRGQRLADGRRVMAVIVVDGDPGRLALALEAASDAREGGEVRTRSPAGASPRRGGRCRDGQGVGRVVPARRRQTRLGGVRPAGPDRYSVEGRGRRVARRHPTEQDRRWSGVRPETLGDRHGRSLRVAAAPGRRGHRPRPSLANRRGARRPRRRRRPPTLAMSVALVGRAAEPRLEGVRRPRTIARRRRDGPTPRSSGRRRRAGRDRSCRRTRRPRRRTQARSPSGRCRGARRSAAHGSSAPTKADGSRPGHGQDVDQPAGRGALAVRPGDADQRPPDRRVCDDLLPRLQGDAGSPGGDQLRVVRVDGGERLGDRESLRPRRRGDVRRRDGQPRPRSPAPRARRCTATARRGRKPMTDRTRPAPPGGRQRWPRHRRRRRRGSARRAGSVARRGPVRGRPGRDPPRRSRRIRGALRSARAGARAAASALSRLLSTRSPRPQVAADLRPCAVGHRHVGQPDGLLRAPAVRPGDPGDGRPRGRRRSALGPRSAMASATWAETAPCAARTVVGTPTRSRLSVVRVRDEAAEVVGARARDLGDERARRGRRCTIRRSRRAGPWSTQRSLQAGGQDDERIVRHGATGAGS